MAGLEDSDITLTQSMQQRQSIVDDQIRTETTQEDSQTVEKSQNDDKKIAMQEKMQQQFDEAELQKKKAREQAEAERIAYDNDIME